MKRSLFGLALVAVISWPRLVEAANPDIQIPRPAPAAFMRGPVPLTVVDSRAVAADSPTRVQLGDAGWLKLGTPLSAVVTRLAIDGAASSGLWLKPDRTGLGATREPSWVSVSLQELSCSRRVGTVECTAFLVVTLTTKEGLRSTAISIESSGGTASEAFSTALGEMTAEFTALGQQFLTSIGPLDIRAASEASFSAVSWQEGRAKYVGVGQWQSRRGWCVILSGNGELHWLPRQRLDRVDQIIVAGASPGDRLVWLRGLRAAAVVHRSFTDGWVQIRVTDGLRLLPPGVADGYVYFPAAGMPGDCDGSVAELEARVRILGKELTPGLSENESLEIQRIARRARAREGRAMFSGGVPIVVIGGLVLASSFITGIDACYQAEEPCNPYPQAVFTLPIGGLIMAAGIPLIVGGGAQWARND